MICALYRHFDATGTLLYVGISLSAVQRLSQHSASPWADEIARVDVERFATREAAEAAERVAIKSEKPLHNKAHSASNEAAEAHNIIKALGRPEVAAALGVAEKTVIDHVSRGVFPAAWFSVIRDMAERAGVPCDERLFSFKRQPAA